MKPEQRLWSRFRAILAGLPGLRCDRIEARGLAVGVPDVAYSYKDHHGWIELKVAKRGSISHWTPVQRRWLRERHNIGGHCWLLVGFGEEMYLIDAARADRLGDKVDEAILREACVFTMPGDFDHMWLSELL